MRPTGLVVGALIVGALLISSAWADPKHYLYQRTLRADENRSFSFLGLLDDGAEVESGQFEQKLNHLDLDDSEAERDKRPRTFAQRYYINSQYATDAANAPVIYIICGEGSCGEGEVKGVTMSRYAKALGAHLVALEHRYYGKSQPFKLLTGENLRFLTTQNALADLNAFQKNLQKTRGWQGPWIAVGGSYAASLAAYYRQKYPQNVVGALASSGPVQAKAAFEEYDLTVFTVAGSDCVANMRKVVAAAEKAMADAETAQAFKTRFQAQEVREAIDFLYVIADQASIAVQYGKRDEFCAALEEAGDDLQALIDAYAKKGKEMFDWFGITAVQDSYQGSESLDAADYEEGVGMRQWVYQTCSEYGYFQVAYRDPAKSARSSRITLPYHFEVCERLFGLKKPLDEKLTNEKYYLPLLNEKDAATKNILLTNGANDPWAMLSITKELGNDTNPNLLSLMIPGASHCEDLTSRMGTELEKVRDLTLALFQKWVARE